MSKILAHGKKPDNASVSPFELSMIMRGRVRLEFGMGLSRREIWVSDAQEQAMNVLRGKRPLTEKLAFDVLRKEGEKQPAKQ